MFGTNMKDFVRGGLPALLDLGAEPPTANDSRPPLAAAANPVVRSEMQEPAAAGATQAGPRPFSVGGGGSALPTLGLTAAFIAVAVLMLRGR